MGLVALDIPRGMLRAVNVCLFTWNTSCFHATLLRLLLLLVGRQSLMQHNSSGWLHTKIVHICTIRRSCFVEKNSQNAARSTMSHLLYLCGTAHRVGGAWPTPRHAQGTLVSSLGIKHPVFMPHYWNICLSWHASNFWWNKTVRSNNNLCG